MPLARTFFEDAAHVRQETHVQHAVGFVEDDMLHPVELAVALLNMIEQSARRGDQNVHAGAEGIVLFAVTDAAEDHGDAQIGEACEIADGGLDLGGEFAGRLQHQQARLGLVLIQLGKDREGERSGLARAGLGAADDVTPFHDQRNGTELNGRGVHVAHRLHAFEYRRRKTKFSKRHISSV